MKIIILQSKAEWEKKERNCIWKPTTTTNDVPEGQSKNWSVENTSKWFPPLWIG